MRKIFFYQNGVIFFLLFFSFSFSAKTAAQTITVKGVISDSINPLGYVNIIAKPTSDDQADLKFAITKEDGKYSMDLQKGVSYSVKITYLGYRPMELKIEASEDISRNFVLEEETEQLDEVVIISEIPVLVKKDTIIFDTKAFTDGKEFKLKNVLEKLPGVEVENNGDVTVNGKKVTKMLVEGNSFFGGDSKLAVENIPADAVDNVEVIDNYSAIGFLKDYVDSDEMAMNITLQEDKKDFVFGDVKSSGGPNEFYENQAGLFYYSSRTTASFIGDLNNTGKKSFTLKDYLNFEGGVSQIIAKDGISRNSSISDFSDIINTEPAFKAKNQFAAINITGTINEKFSMSGYGIFSKNAISSQNNMINTYFYDDLSFEESINSLSNNNDILGIGKVLLSFTPSFKEKLFFDFQVKINESDKTTDQSVSINNFDTSFLERNKKDGINLSQNFEWHKNFNAKHTTSLVVKNSYSRSLPNTLWRFDEPIPGALIPIIDEPNISLFQDIDFEDHRLEKIFNHYWVLDSKTHLYSSIGNNYLAQEYENEDRQILLDGTINEFTSEGFNNDLRFTFNDFFLGNHLKRKEGSLTLKGGYHLHKLDWDIEQESNLSKSKWLFLPDVSAEYEINSSEKLELSYGYYSNFTDAPNLANRFKLLSYNRVFRGNPNLENETFTRGTLSYSKFAMYNGLIMNASLSYRKRDNFIRSQVQVTGIDQFLTPELLETPETSISSLFNIRKKIKKIELKAGVRATYSEFQKRVNNQSALDISKSLTLSPGIKTRFKTWPNLDISHSLNLNKYNSIPNESNFSSNQTNASIDYTFLKHFSISYDISNTVFKDDEQNIRDTFTISNFSFSFQRNNSPFRIELTGNNIFNVQRKTSSSFSNFLSTNRSNQILPRIILLGINYKL